MPVSKVDKRNLSAGRAKYTYTTNKQPSGQGNYHEDVERSGRGGGMSISSAQWEVNAMDVSSLPDSGSRVDHRIVAA